VAQDRAAAAQGNTVATWEERRWRRGKNGSGGGGRFGPVFRCFG